MKHKGRFSFLYLSRVGVAFRAEIYACAFEKGIVFLKNAQA